MNLSMKENEGIRSYFEGDDSYIPTAELIYAWERPMLENTFLTEINKLAVEMLPKLNSKSKQEQEKVAKTLSDLVLLLISESEKSEIPTEESALSILKILREVHKICTS